MRTKTKCGNNIKSIVVRMKECNKSLRHAILHGADLHGANLYGADLRYADLRCADLRGANLNLSAWPLWCGTVGVKTDRVQLQQLAYHAMCNMNKDVLREFLADPVAFANEFANRKHLEEVEV